MQESGAGEAEGNAADTAELKLPAGLVISPAQPGMVKLQAGCLPSPAQDSKLIEVGSTGSKKENNTESGKTDSKNVIELGSPKTEILPSICQRLMVSIFKDFIRRGDPRVVSFNPISSSLPAPTNKGFCFISPPSILSSCVLLSSCLTKEGVVVGTSPPFLPQKI